MEVSPKEMRKLLNAAWDKGDDPYRDLRPRPFSKRNARYRDVSRILEAKKKEQRKDGRDGTSN